jgi:hypothetical protein
VPTEGILPYLAGSEATVLQQFVASGCGGVEAWERVVFHLIGGYGRDGGTVKL